jgi:hypothetical protein
MELLPAGGKMNYKTAECVLCGREIAGWVPADQDPDTCTRCARQGEQLSLSPRSAGETADEQPESGPSMRAER